MTRAETAQLLALAAAYDRRTLGEADVYAWHAALTNTDYTDARQAVIDHHAESRAWLMPADVRARVEAIQSDRAARAGLPSVRAATPEAQAAGAAACRAALEEAKQRRIDGEESIPRS